MNGEFFDGTESEDFDLMDYENIDDYGFDEGEDYYDYDGGLEAIGRGRPRWGGSRRDRRIMPRPSRRSMGRPLGKSYSTPSGGVASKMQVHKALNVVGSDIQNIDERIRGTENAVAASATVSSVMGLLKDDYPDIFENKIITTALNTIAPLLLRPFTQKSGSIESFFSNPKNLAVLVPAVIAIYKEVTKNTTGAGTPTATSK